MNKSIKSKINIEMVQAYKNILNVDLFNKIVSFILETTSVECNGFINKLQAKNIWFERILNNDIQEQYGFKYFGELLERCEQRIGADIKDIRAIALALGYSRELITNEMITGTQLVDFINRIKRIAKNDMYIKAALYLYDENRYYNLFEEIAFQKFNKTEDIVFALSLFYDIKHGFDLLETQLNELLGKSKTISAMDNYSIYKWLINNVYLAIKDNRKKGLELFKAFITIPIGLIKEDSKTYQILNDNGYSKEEISFLNYISIYYSNIPKTVRVGNSIVEEKIAVNFCKTILNSETLFSDNIYNLIYEMLSHYYRFDIKCYGFENIKDAIINSINIKVPQVFIKFYNKFDKRIFSFDILDTKWDLVKNSMEAQYYMELFDSYLLFNNFSKDQIIIRINKYDNLTNTNYLSTFNVYRYGRCSIYSKLVQNDVISLEKTFNDYLLYKKNNEESNSRKNIDLEHIKEYIKNIESRKAFEFIRYFLSINNHKVSDLSKYYFSLGDLYKHHYRNSYYYCYDEILDIKRSFLSPDEQRELLGWLEEYMFFERSDYYLDFAYHLLKDSYIKTILTYEELRSIYFELINFDRELKKDLNLRKMYLSKEELEKIEKEEADAEEEKRLLAIKEIELSVSNKFKSIENINFKNLYEYCYSYRCKKEETSVACKLVKDYINNYIEKHTFITEEIKYFNKICNLLIEQDFITAEEVKNYYTRYIKEGELVQCKEYYNI